MSASPDRQDGNAGVSDFQSRRALRRTRAARTQFWQTVLVSSFIALVLGANLFIGAVVVFGAVKSQFQSKDRPADVRTGHFTQFMLDGTFCRTVVFDNKSAETIYDKVALCDKSVRSSGSGGRTRFNWGGN